MSVCEYESSVYMYVHVFYIIPYANYVHVCTYTCTRYRTVIGG